MSLDVQDDDIKAIINVSNITHTPLRKVTGKLSIDLVSVREPMSHADGAWTFNNCSSKR